MIVASGFVETDGLINVENIVSELETRKMEINEVLNAKIIFMIERDTIGAVKSELDEIRNIDGVKNVHLAYYSLEGTDEDSAAGDSA
jgi:nitrate reductase NapAB chaperone NapD